MKRTILFFALLFFSISTTIGQNQNNQWRFGRSGGINFNSSPPVFVSGSSIATGEGSASVADPVTGNLLFYTDGVTVWNAQNTIMPNGSNLRGGAPILLSSTTAAVIVPKPQSTTQFYIFTINELGAVGGTQGLHYSVVDMSLNNGLGDVISSQKNRFLLLTTSEKLEVIPASNQQDYWIVTNDNQDFYSFRVSAAGVSSTPVISSVGGNFANTAGHLKINRQFNLLAAGSLFDRQMRLFNFNQTTGAITNAVAFALPSIILNNSPLIYGVEFSPNGKVLYISNLNSVIQYDISSLNATSIENSAYTIISGSSAQPASLQLAPDGKIYLNDGSLNTIECPDQLGANCNYQTNVFPGQTGGGGYGLHKWVFYANETFRTDSLWISAVDSCLGSSTQIRLNGLSKSLTIPIRWNFGDPASGSSNIDTGISVNHQFSSTGFFKITALVPYPCFVDTVILDSFKVVDCSPPPCLSNLVFFGDSCLENLQFFSVNSSNTILQVRWNFGDPMSSSNLASGVQVNHLFSKVGFFQVEAIVQMNCGFDTLSFSFDIRKCSQDTFVPVECKVLLPNSFSPNEDGKNDFFQPVGSCSFEKYEMVVYDRWGQELFFSNRSDDLWNGSNKQGKACWDGVYPYVFQYQLPNEKPKVVKGLIRLIR